MAKSVKFLSAALVAAFSATACVLASSVFAAGACDAGNIGNVSECLDSMQPKNALKLPDNDGDIKSGVRAKAVAIANRVISLVALVAIAGIVFAGFHMVTAYGDDEKHKKGKEALKWAVLGFAVALLSFPLVNATINFFYSA